MNYVITNGNVYLRLSESGAPVTCNKELAQIFTEAKAKNICKCLPKTMQKFHFQPKIYNMETVSIPPVNDKPKEFSPEDLCVIMELDDFYKDYEENTNRDNFHKYSNRTVLEDLDDIPGTLKNMITIISQMDAYIENMEYLQRELDLKILDIRHYIRNNRTRLGTVHMGKIGYILQDLERQRITCKMNKNFCQLFLDNYQKLKNPRFVEIIEKMENTEYRYRRLDEGEINQLIGRSVH